jgi:hypothetical protein
MSFPLETWLLVLLTLTILAAASLLEGLLRVPCRIPGTAARHGNASSPGVEASERTAPATAKQTKRLPERTVAASPLSLAVLRPSNWRASVGTFPETGAVQLQPFDLASDASRHPP